MFKKAGKSVTYNDVLRFNYLIGKAIIENQNILLTEDDYHSLLLFDDEPQREGFIATHFKGDYYLDEENAWLDGVVDRLQRMSRYSAETLEYKKAIAYYALFQSCLVKRPFNLFHRKNLYLRMNDVTRTFGNKSTWARSFEACFGRFVLEANKLVFDSGKQCKSINRSVLDLDEYGFDLVYLDPPYFRREGTNETSNYAKCYHFLEGIARYPEWPSLLRNKTEVETSNPTERNIIEFIDALLEKFRRSTIVISYKQGGVPSTEFIYQRLKKLKTKVHRCSKHYKYALNRQNGQAKSNREVLLIGE